MGTFYCAVCRQTSFSGKGHRYEKSHQAKLKVVLVKFLEKVKEARRTVKNPRVEKFCSAEHETNFWCYCCAREVPKHVSSGNIAVLFGGLLAHMSTSEHKKNTNKFWWENKADPKLKEKFLVTSEETERFKTEVARALETFAEKEDELIKEQAAVIRAQEQHRHQVLQSLLEHEAELEQCGRGPRESAERGDGLELGPTSGRSPYSRLPEGVQEAQSSWTGLDEQSQWSGDRSSLTFIGYQDSSTCGNIHTGAVPPWLLDDPLEGSSGNTEQEIGPSHQEFLKHKEQEKLRKLPAHRVGANFDHSSQTDANWLPSFGRVWNSGRRWQSRHQFREEEGHVGRQKRKWSSMGKGGKRQQPDLQ